MSTQQLGTFVKGIQVHWILTSMNRSDTWEKEVYFQIHRRQMLTWLEFLENLLLVVYEYSSDDSARPKQNSEIVMKINKF